MCTWAKRWRVDRGQVRRFFKLLESDQMATIKTTSKTTMITICNYESYQDYRPSRDTTKRPSNEHQVNTNNNDNNDNNSIGAVAQKKKTFKNWTKQDFVDDLKQFQETFDKDVLNEFYKHWVEPSPLGKMKLQLEKTWDTNLRLQKWMRTKENFKK
jgi:hypothetical protein